MATRKVYCSYQEIIDLHTESDKVTAIGFHVPNTDTPHKMFGGLYDQFKKVKYLGMSVSFVPVARLPVDPLGVSYEAGEPGMDPRDVVNPILIHGCHGQDLGTILNNLYTGQIGALGNKYDTDSTNIFEFINSVSPAGEQLDFTVLENLYYKALVDNTWQKAHPQKGFRKSGLHPMVYNVVANHQINPALAVNAFGNSVITQANGIPAGYEVEGTMQQGGWNATISQDVAMGNVRMFTNRLVPMGWMDTRNTIIPFKSETGFVTSQKSVNEVMADLLDQTTVRSKFDPIFMMVCLLPPAYKTEQYFRCIINHNFVFAGFRGMSFNNSDADLMPPSVFDLNEEMSVGDDSNDDNGGDDNGGGDDSLPVITLSTETSVGSGKYSKYQIDDSTVINLGSKVIFVSINGGVAQLNALTISDSKILGTLSSSTVTFDFETMKNSNNADFIVSDANDNTDLIELLQSGDYTVEVDSDD